MFKTTKLAAGLLAACGGVLMSAGAYAQSSAPAQGQQLERVDVTGSRILSVNADSPAPIIVITSEDIARSGVTNLQELLLKNPVLGTPTISRSNSNFQNSSVGVSTIDLRNLGESRTLVLVNGRRFVSGVPGDQAVDLNTIPTDFVERIEILTGGASAAYGSDAVAGVVNIILKRDFQGLALNAHYGESKEGDDRTKRVSATFGTTSGDGKGNVMAHLAYSDQGAVFSRDRDRSAVDQASLGAFVTGDPADIFTARRPFNSSFAPQGRFFHGSGNSTFDASGNLIPFSSNGPAGDGVGATGFNRSAFRTIAVPTERFLFSSKGDYAIAEKHTAYFEGTYAASQTKSELEPYPLGSEDAFPATGGQVPAEFLVNGAYQVNPLIPASLLGLLTDTDGDGARDYYFTRRMAELGGRGNIANRDTFRVMTGVKGELTSTLNYDLYGAYGKTKESQVGGGQVNVVNFRNALQVVPGADGNPVCLDPNAVAEGCVPASVFGFNSLSPAAAKYIQAPTFLSTETTQQFVGGFVSGEPMNLPAGPLGVAAGFEYRDEYARSEFDALTQAGLNAGNAIPRTEGGYDVKELFAEVRVPLLKDMPAAKSLVASAGVRGGDYSTVGTTVSWNAGLEWVVNSDIKVRGTRARSVRAPNINELYQPPSQDFPTGISDPCLGVTATSTENSAAACRANAGVAANIAANGAFTLNQADLQGISGFNRGNPNAEEETGNSWTLGLAITPTSIEALKNFAFTIDYFNIKISDALVSLDRQFALDQCYGGDASFCAFVKRRPANIGANSAGSLDEIDSAVANTGDLSTSGVDLSAAYREILGPGTLNARLSYTYLIDGYETPQPGAPRNYFREELGAAKNRASLTLGYNFGPWGIYGQTTYIGRSSLDDQFLLSTFDLPRNSVQVGSITYQDLQASYDLNKTAQFYFGIDNVFDREPPRVISGLPGNDTGTETDAGTYDPIGRRFNLGIRLRF